MPVERSAQAYGPAITGASRSVLLELAAALRAYRDALVLVGGWVPYFLLDQHRRRGSTFAHVGSIDIDLAVDPRRVHEPEYATIVELLLARGYEPAEGRGGAAMPHSLQRVILSPLTRKPYTIRVDFLVPASGPMPPHHLSVQENLFARKVRGCEAAFTYATTLALAGTLPEGGELSVTLRMADLVGILTMKGIVLGERYREKDAYDIYALVKHYGQGPDEAAALVRPFADEPLVRQALEQIAQAFGARQAHGPAWVAAFLVQSVFAAERERLITDAHLAVSDFLRLVL